MYGKKIVFWGLAVIALSMMSGCTPEAVTETVKLTDTVTSTNNFTITAPAVTITDTITKTETTTEIVTETIVSTTEEASTSITSHEGIQLEIKYDESAVGHVWEQNTRVQIKAPGVVITGKIYHNYGGDYIVPVTCELYDANGTILNNEYQEISVPGEYGRQFTFTFEIADPSEVSLCIVTIHLS